MINYNAPNHPKCNELGSRSLRLTKELYIDSPDFRTLDDKKFYALAPNLEKTVGLKYGPNIYYLRHEIDEETGNVTCVHVKADFLKRTKPKTHIHWLSVDNALRTQFRLYELLLSSKNADEEEDFLRYLNPKSETLRSGFVEKEVSSWKPFTSFQLERVGYFTVDPDTQSQELVMNRIVPLKEDNVASSVRRQ